MTIEYSIIIESYNLSESESLNESRLLQSIRAAQAITQEIPGGEILIADVTGDSVLQQQIRGECPDVRIIEHVGAEYDYVRMVACRDAARGIYLLYLDGDCLPQPNWAQTHLEFLRAGGTSSGGYSRYDESGLLSSISSVQDFGMFYPLYQRPLKCYASNNCSFSKQFLKDFPVPVGDLRCACYAHSQVMWKNQTPAILLPGARVFHEPKPLITERTRQGYDTISSCWADPGLPEAGFLRFGPFSVLLFYAMQVILDWSRLYSARRELSLNFLQTFVALIAMPILRLLDLAGMIYAFWRGPGKGGWDGYSVKKFEQPSKPRELATNSHGGG